MGNRERQFEFTAALFKNGKTCVCLCLDLDVASQGKTIREAKKNLAEAVSLYLEGCFERNLPYLRPVPKNEDPRFTASEGFVELFPLKVAFQVRAVA
jgi:predicted RNase H-like HicB family nuclease